MTKDPGFLVAIMLISVFAVGCSTCINDVVQRTSSFPDGEATATLLTRRCGSSEGWAVKLKPSGYPEREIFQAEMPDPVSVVEVANGVHLRWAGRTHLVVEAPVWILSDRSEKSYGGITIAYQSNDVPYPYDKATR